MSPIKDLCLDYKALNEEGTFSGGDMISGSVTFTLTEETKVKCLMVKAKGDADVRWIELSDKSLACVAHKRYFKLKEYLIPEDVKSTVLPQGVHCFKFSFKIPDWNMPSSFQGDHGKIVYMLEAKLYRSRQSPTGVKKEFNFISKSSVLPDQVMCPQSGSVDKEMGGSPKVQVRMSATVNTKVCSPGDTISVVAKICNPSSKKMTLKFHLEQKIVYRAPRSTKTTNKSLCKAAGTAVAQKSEETVSCQLKVPADVILSLHHCELISVEYVLKAYLDISFAVDPEMLFPLVIVASGSAPLQPNGDVGPQ